MFAVININKPEGLTSHEVVSRLRKAFNMKKIGHGGTLDPMATGVLPVCLGNATRLLEFFPDDKRYRLEITFGIETVTLDREGEETARTDASAVTAEKISQLLPRFVGRIEQRIPMHSAKRIDGKKLYEMAHKGMAIETPTKTVDIFEATLVAFQNPGQAHPVAVIDVHCGTGTYMRALARDLGELLGCGAHLSNLIRTAHGKFNVSDAVDLDTVREATDPKVFLQDPAPYLTIPTIELRTVMEADHIAHGLKLGWLDAPKGLKDKDPVYVTFKNQPVAIAHWTSKQIKPAKVFREIPVKV